MRSFSMKMLSLAVLCSTGNLDAVAADFRTDIWPTGWSSPLGTRTVKVTANYGALSRGCTNHDDSHEYTWYEDDENSTKGHTGLDLDADVGDDVFPIGDGIVTSVVDWGPIWGYAVHVRHESRSGYVFTVVYGHVERGTNSRTNAEWEQGDVIFGGEIIGTVFNNHLHIGLADGEQFDIKGRSKSKLRINKKGTKCTFDPDGTKDPIATLENRKARSRASIFGGIVGWRNDDFTVTSWYVDRTSDGEYGRYWIPTVEDYWCLVDDGAYDWGPNITNSDFVYQHDFLDQLPDQWGKHAGCWTN